MRVSFACPSCDARGSADSVHVGKQVRCKHCGADFAIPRPGAEESDVYALDEPDEAASRWVPPGSNPGAVFVPSRGGDERRSSDRPRPRRDPEGPARHRKEEAEFPLLPWLIRGAIGLAVVVGLIALLAPHGTWLAGCILLVIGSVLVVIGYAAGAYGAFREDLLYGLLYLAIPLYTAYYMVTRWDDLRVWFTGSTIGVGLVLLGTEMIHWAATQA